MIRIHECFYHFKHIYNDMAKKADKLGTAAGSHQIMKEGLGIEKD